MHSHKESSHECPAIWKERETWEVPWKQKLLGWSVIVRVTSDSMQCGKLLFLARRGVKTNSIVGNRDRRCGDRWISSVGVRVKTKIYEFIFAHWWRRSRRSNGKVDEKEQLGFLALTSDAFFSFSFLSTPFSVLFRKHKSLKSHSFDYFSCALP